MIPRDRSSSGARTIPTSDAEDFWFIHGLGLAHNSSERKVLFTVHDVGRGLKAPDPSRESDQVPRTGCRLAA